jgi:hypothetical protein
VSEWTEGITSLTTRTSTSLLLTTPPRNSHTSILLSYDGERREGATNVVCDTYHGILSRADDIRTGYTPNITVAGIEIGIFAILSGIYWFREFSSSGLQVIRLTYRPQETRQCVHARPL